MKDNKIPDLRCQLISPLLYKSLYGSLGTFRRGDVSSRFMIFANNETLTRFYFITPRETDKVTELKDYPNATLSILSPAPSLEDYAETMVIGRIEILEDLHASEAQEGLEALAAKSSQVKDVIQGKELHKYCLLQLSTKEIVFRVYNDIINSRPKTILKF
jgi:general stress protein 26